MNVRQLRDGRSRQAVCESLEGSRLHLRFHAIPADGEFEAGELVEVNTLQALYLGEITSRTGELILVVVEHGLDREALAAIREVWHRPDGS